MEAMAVPEPDSPSPRNANNGHPPVWRRLFHFMAGSTAPIIGVFASQEAMVVLLSVLAGMAIAVEAARFIYAPLNKALMRSLKPLLKSAEGHRVTGATYMLVASLACFLLFDKGIAVAALFFLSLGDPAAALVGKRATGFRLWGKSPWGTLAMFSVAAAMSLVLWSTGVWSPLWMLLVGALAAAATETIPLGVDDNTTVPLISGAVMALLTL